MYGECIKKKLAKDQGTTVNGLQEYDLNFQMTLKKLGRSLHSILVNKKCNNMTYMYSGRYLIWLTLILTGALIYSLYTFNFGSLYSYVNKLQKVHVQKEYYDFVVDNFGCRIPDMDPFDPLLKTYIKKIDFDCANANQSAPLVGSNLTGLFIIKSSLTQHNVTLDQVACCYRPFRRLDGNLKHYSYGVDNKIHFSKKCFPFRNEVIIRDEFVRVECRIQEEFSYTDYFAFIPLKNKVEKRCDSVNQNLQQNKQQIGMSVLVIGIDAVSRLNFHRQMPKTEAFLRELKAIEMLGYNKVGDNTFPNLIPVLTGMKEEELQKKCWPTTYTSFDRCSFLWNNFSSAGYRTAFGEDAPWMGIFSYLKAGFVVQPTDYYMRAYSKSYEDAFGNALLVNTKLCIKSRYNAEVLLEYASKFARSMISKRSFGFFWEASLTHDDFNFPSLGDVFHKTFLSELVSARALNNTLLVVMSDHGMRWGSFRQTYQGSLEERLPLLSFVFPSWFRERYPEAVSNVQANTQRLTTPFDLHLTLLDLLDLSSIENSSILSRAKDLESVSPQPRGVSLFLPVSNTRTCLEAGIIPHWCTCQRSKPLPPESRVVRRMALFLVGYLNQLLKPYSQCSKLQLTSIHDAQYQYPHEHINNFTSQRSHLRDYILVVQTHPGNGIFEATVRQRPTSEIQITGVVSRINIYGEQSSCVQDYHIKLYCFCS